MMKNTIKIACAIMLGVLLAHKPVQAQQQLETSVNYIETFGFSEGDFDPDKITISILLNEADSRKKPLADLQKKMIEAFVKMGIDVEKNLKVISMQASLKKYVLSKDDVLQKREFELIVSDFATANKVFEVLDWLGVSTAYITKWELENYEKALGVLKLEAINKGKAQAQEMAAAAGSKVGETLLIQDERRYDRNQFVRFSQEKMVTRSAMVLQDVAGSMQAEPEINFGPIKLNVTVQLRFKLLGAKQ